MIRNLSLQLLYTVPSTPGKMMTVFPVMEKSWNFIILPNIMEKWGKPWKKGLSVIFAHVIFFCCIGLCPFKCTFGRHFGTFVLLWCFQMAGYMGLLGLACCWITRREIEPQPTVALRLHLVRLVLTALANLFTLPGGRLRLGGETRFSPLVRV